MIISGNTIAKMSFNCYDAKALKYGFENQYLKYFANNESFLKKITCEI